jgi:hypothetical protein
MSPSAIIKVPLANGSRVPEKPPVLVIYFFLNECKNLFEV